MARMTNTAAGDFDFSPIRRTSFLETIGDQSGLCYRRPSQRGPNGLVTKPTLIVVVEVERKEETIFF